ncbi:helix-turn-helix domain-containing protein [Achromobacter marplatensis]|uniref:helix-turn-helix domain-containing protein n=1 Tax=Achromobacter marplatensis TaxID=470868 RepID=UPI0039F71792
MTQDFASAVSDTPASAAGNVGSALRALRQSKGWSLDEVSSRIKFSTKQIEALENEAWADLPTGVSLRGLVRNYARLLGADSQAIVDSLDPKARVTGPVKLSPGALHSAHSIPQSSADDDRSSSTSWGWLIAIVLVLAAGVAYAFWQGWLPQQWLPFDWLQKPTK